jgi:hypothetical protein
MGAPHLLSKIKSGGSNADKQVVGKDISVVSPHSGCNLDMGSKMDVSSLTTSSKFISQLSKTLKLNVLQTWLNYNPSWLK